MTTKPKADDHVVPPFLGDANARPGPRPGAFLVEVTERELEMHHEAVVEAEDVILCINRTASFMQAAIDGGFADMGELSAYLALVARATDPGPKLLPETAARFSDRLRHLTRHKPEGAA